MLQSLGARVAREGSEYVVRVLFTDIITMTGQVESQLVKAMRIDPFVAQKSFRKNELHAPE